jgi:thymidylate synthase
MIDVETLDGEDYNDVCRDVLRLGRRVSPRGQETVELADAVIRVERSHLTLPLSSTRAPKPAIAAAEALQLVGEVSYPQLMPKITKVFAGFMDGGTFHGAYGPRVRGQFASVVQKIRDDKDTRQAVVTIWDPVYDNLPGYRDYPCTLSLTFCVRDGALETHATMRSNDVWLGLAYDAFQFSQAGIAVARSLGIPPGPHYHHAVSLHAYERDWEKIEDLRQVDSLDMDCMRGGTSRDRARDILAGRTIDRPNGYEAWAEIALGPYL